MLADANGTPPPITYAYVIEVHKYPCGRICFRVVVSDGGAVLVPWTTLPAGMSDPFAPARHVVTSGLAQPVEAEPMTRSAWEVIAETDMGLRVSRPNGNHVQFRNAETGTLEADWWPSTGRLKIHGLAVGAVGTWTDVRTGERALHLLRQA